MHRLGVDGESKVTATERKRAERARYKAAGLVPVQVWVPPQAVQRVREYADKVAKKLSRPNPP